MSRSWLSFKHRADLYDKSVASSSSGQRIASWAKSGESICLYSMGRTTIRVSPTTEETDMDTLYFPHDAGITYETRIYNIRDLYGNTIKAGPLEVTSIQIATGFSGKPNHLQVRVETVIE